MFERKRSVLILCVTTNSSLVSVLFHSCYSVHDFVMPILGSCIPLVKSPLEGLKPEIGITHWLCKFGNSKEFAGTPITLKALPLSK